MRFYWEWNGLKRPSHLGRGCYAENFEWHHGYVPTNRHKVTGHLSLRASSGMDQCDIWFIGKSSCLWSSVLLCICVIVIIWNVTAHLIHCVCVSAVVCMVMDRVHMKYVIIIMDYYHGQSECIGRRSPQ